MKRKRIVPSLHRFSACIPRYKDRSFFLGNGSTRENEGAEILHEGPFPMTFRRDKTFSPIGEM